MPLRPLPSDFCPINDDLPEGWYCPVTILPEGYFIRLVKQKRKLRQKHIADPGKMIEMKLFEEL